MRILTFLLVATAIGGIIYIVFFDRKIKADVAKKLRLNYARSVEKNICVNVELYGINRADESKILGHIDDFCAMDRDNPFNLEILKQKIIEDYWVRDIYIQKQLPYNLKIVIGEHEPFALWQTDGKLYLIDEGGDIINVPPWELWVFNRYLVIAGEGALENIPTLFNVLSVNTELSSRVKTALMLGERRWNFGLDNGVVVKMPEKNLISAWGKLDKLLSIPGLEVDLKTIDLRDPDKIFLEYSDSSIREILNHK